MIFNEKITLSFSWKEEIVPSPFLEQFEVFGGLMVELVKNKPSGLIFCSKFMMLNDG